MARQHQGGFYRSDEARAWEKKIHDDPVYHQIPSSTAMEQEYIGGETPTAVGGRAQATG